MAYVHATVAPGARLDLPWQPDFNALAYVMGGTGGAGGGDHRGGGAPIGAGQLAVFGPGDFLRLTAAERQDSTSRAGLDVIILGGQPIREPVAWYGPFVMNTKAELVQAVEDYQAGRLGVIPPNALMPHVVRD
jgi:redox-sensitive bicupin YhaK (pirin superfamily)